MSWHRHLLLSMPCLTLLLLTPVENACPTLCSCGLDQRGKRTVLCQEGNMTLIPATEMDIGTELLYINPVKFRNTLTLSPIFQHLRSLQEIKIHHSSLTQIGMHTFWGVPSLRLLDLSFNNISSLSDHNFRGLLNLEELKLDDNEIKELPSGVFRHLTELKTLGLQRNRVKELVPKVFVKLSKLTELRLSGNPLVELRPEAFKDVVELKVLECRACGIRRINTQIYHLLPYLTYLDLGRNRMQFLPSEEFRDLRRIRTLLLDRNQLPVILEKTFENQPLLQTLSLARNRLAKITNTAFVNMSSLTDLDISYNQLNKLEGVSFYPIAASLKVLDLSGNKFAEEVLDVILRTTNKLLTLHVAGLGLTYLTPGLLPSTLKFLNISNNNISRISVQSLPKNLLELDVSRNKFRGFEDRLVLRLEQLKSIKGDDNPWACDWCSGKFIILRVNKTKLFDNFTCASPLRLQGIRVKNLKVNQISDCTLDDQSERDTFLGLMEENSILIFGGAFLIVFLVGCVCFVVFSCWKRNVTRTVDEEGKMDGTVLTENPSAILGVKAEISFQFPLDLTERRMSVSTIDEIKTQCRSLPNGTVI